MLKTISIILAHGVDRQLKVCYQIVTLIDGSLEFRKIDNAGTRVMELPMPMDGMSYIENEAIRQDMTRQLFSKANKEHAKAVIARVEKQLHIEKVLL